MPRTGVKVIQTLRKYVNGVKTSETKTNTISDEDYIQQYYDFLECVVRDEDVDETTTAAPTTAAPTTASPTTAAPTTSAPTTSAPTTAAPTTAAPTTSAPTTAAPTTAAPTTAAPTTAAPTTAAPTTAAPTSFGYSQQSYNGYSESVKTYLCETIANQYHMYNWSLYHDGTGVYPQVGDTLYYNATKTSLFTGMSSHTLGTTFKAYNGPVIQVNNTTGVVERVEYC